MSIIKIGNNALNKSMSDFEKLRESKVAYEYILDILESLETRIDTTTAKELRKSMKILNDIYRCAYNNLENSNKKEQLITDACCKNCNDNLLISDNIDYSYQCVNCDENFYNFEAISNDIWYKDVKKEHNLLPSSFDIQVSFDKNNNKVYIEAENHFKIKYDCKSFDEFVEAIEIYCNNYLTPKDLIDEQYSIEIWETEWHRDIGEAFKYFKTYDNFDTALKVARKLYEKNNYACIEILNDKNETLYCCDETSEDFYFKYDRFSRVSKETVDNYIDNWMEHIELPTEMNKLYCESNSIFVAIDNSSGGCLVEEFKTENEAQKWLLGFDDTKLLERDTDETIEM